MKHNLHTFVVLHYVYGAFVCLIGTLLLVLIVMGSAMQGTIFAELGADPPMRWLAAFLQGSGLILFVLIEAKGLMNIISAGLIAKCKGRTFTYVTAAFNCFSIPFGLGLAIFTFITMGDKQVRMAYGSLD